MSKPIYSKQALWTLFLMSAVLPHLWALILIFRDMSWAAERTNAWDAVGVAAYGLFFTLIESIALFLIAALLGLLTPRAWSIEKRTAFLSLLVLLLCLWGILGQLGFLLEANPPAPLAQLLRQSGHPIRILYILAIAAVVLSVALPVGWFLRALRSERGTAVIQGVIDRLSILAGFYLIFDAAGIIILLVRNIG